MQKLITTSLVCATLCAAVPATAQNREHLQMAAELRMLQQQNQQLSLAVSQLIDALKTVNTRLDANEQFQQRRFADQEQNLRNLSNDLSALLARTQDADTRMRSLSDEIDALRKTFLTLPELLARAQAPPPAPVDPNNPAAPAPTPDLLPPVSSAPPAPALPLPPTAGLSPNRMYETAWGDFTAGQYTTAISGLEQLVKTFPDAEKADDAQYLIGESLLHLSRFADAVAAYNVVIQNYPTGDQVDMALYKRGMAQERNGDATGARASWEETVKRFPDSTGATMARQNLTRLNRQTPPAAPARE